MRKILPHTKCHIITYTQFRHLSRFYVFCGFLRHSIIIIDTKEWTYRYNDSTVEFCKPPIRHATLSTLALMHWSFTAENQPTNANIRMELDTWLKWVMRSRHTKSKEPEVHSTFLRSEFNTRNDFTNNLNHIKKNSENKHAKLLLKWWRPTQSKHNWKVFSPIFFSCSLSALLPPSRHSARHGFYLKLRLGKRGLASLDMNHVWTCTHMTHHHSRIVQNVAIFCSHTRKSSVDKKFSWKNRCYLQICSSTQRTKFDGIHKPHSLAQMLRRWTGPNCIHLSHNAQDKWILLSRMFFGTLSVMNFDEMVANFPLFLSALLRISLLWGKSEDFFLTSHLQKPRTENVHIALGLRLSQNYTMNGMESREYPYTAYWRSNHSIKVYLSLTNTHKCFECIGVISCKNTHTVAFRLSPLQRYWCYLKNSSNRLEIYMFFLSLQTKRFLWIAIPPPSDESLPLQIYTRPHASLRPLQNTTQRDELELD